MSDENASKKSNEDDPIDNKSLTNKSENENSSTHKIGDVKSKIQKYNEILAIDMECVKEDNKITKVDVNKNFPVYGYYVRKPIWLYYTSGGTLDYDSSRNSFVLVVFIIDLIMIALTAVWVLMVLNVEYLTEFFEEYNFLLMITAAVVLFGLSYVISCSRCARKMPCSIILLVLVVVAMSVLVSSISVKYDTDILLYAFLATTFVVFCCCLLALTPIDFTQWYLYVIVIAFSVAAALLVMGVVSLFSGQQMSMAKLILLLILTVVNCIMLTIEIQMVLGGRAMELEENEHALAAFLIYNSILHIFMNLVRIFGIVDDY